MRFRDLVGLIVLTTLISTAAAAQVDPRASPVTPPLRVDPDSLRVQPLTNSVSEGQTNGSLLAAASRPISNAPALINFRLWFYNGDHRIRTVGILHEGGAMRANFNDQNGDDPFRVRAEWINVPGATGGTVTQRGSGTFNIQLPPRPADTTLVLSGFSFERNRGTDKRIQTMAINLIQETSVAEVRFMSGAPRGDRPYRVTIQYAFIPNNRVRSNGSISSSGGPIQGQIPRYAATAIRRFSFRFSDVEHNLLGVGVHISGLLRFYGQRESESEAPITWQENQFAGPMQWIVDYTLLN